MPTQRHLHVVSFDVPYPPDYGGAIDVYYKLLSLQQAGVRVHLHCFEYGRGKAEELKRDCFSVHYYRREKKPLQSLRHTPFIVATRSSRELLDRLLEDDYPILFEGLHSTSFLAHPRLRERRKFVRTHNVEFEYYRELASIEQSPFRRLYFILEAGKLKRWERTLHHADHIFAISGGDRVHYAHEHQRVTYIPAFHPNEGVDILTGKGEYALYHGNLAVGENRKAALFLIERVFDGLDIPLVIAGNNPAPSIVEAASQRPNVRIAQDVTVKTLRELIRGAQVHVLPTFQATGIKIKLLQALHLGRWCVVNSPMVAGTGVEELCSIEDTAAGLAERVRELMDRPFGAEEIAVREWVLNKLFNNRSNAEKMLRVIFSNSNDD